MLATKLKDREKLAASVLEGTLAVICAGCREVFFPEAEIEGFLAEKGVKKIIRLEYLCREEVSRAYLDKRGGMIGRPGNVMVFSCGVGVQAAAKILEEIPVLPGCDTVYLNGFQGLRARERDCEQCAECRLNRTGGICPLTACSKSLLNGPCGGAKDGKCEVEEAMDCGWELIYRRLEKLPPAEARDESAQTRDYQKLVTGGE